MERLLRLPILALLVGLLLSQCSYSPPTMNDFDAIEEAQLADMVNIVEAQGVADLSKLDGMPQDIALISFFIYDPGTSTKTEKGPYRAMREGYEMRALTKDGASYYGTKLYEAGISSLVSTFKSHDVNLLKSEEFLTSQEKREYFDSFEPELGFMFRAITKFLGALEAGAKGGEMKASATAPGYRVLMVPADDRKLMTGMRELNDQLEVDAMLVVKNIVATEKKDFRLKGVEMRLVGPNPEPKAPNAPAISYIPAYTYGKAQVEFEDGYAFDFTKESEEFRENYAGYDQLLKVMADELLSYVEGEM